MDNKHTSFNLRVGVGLIVSALLLGQSTVAVAAPKHSAAKTTAKATNRAKATRTSKSAKAASAAKPVVDVAPRKPAVATVTAQVAETVALGADAVELTQPKSTIEAGVLGVTDSNWKFGQYNGLSSSGAYGIGNFDLRGGGAYDSGDATRWRVTGKNIGQENREFTGEYKDQGKYKLNFGYDEIFRFGQGTYQTPYLGVGGNNLTLPSTWLFPTTANNMRTLPASDYASFQDVPLSTKRRRVDGGFSYMLDPQWELKASMRHEDKNGIKSLGASIAPGLRGVILPEPVSQSTEQINASINFTGEKGFASFAYYGSIFHNDYNSINFQNAFSAPTVGPQAAFGRMSTMPDNQFHQFTLTGAYNFSPDTKLIGSGSYGRNWQDQGFLPYSTYTGVMPAQNNLNGAVDSKNVNVKLTHKATQDLNFAAAYKYDERENLSAVNTYQFVAQDGVPNPAGTNYTERSNTPFSRRVQTGNLDANYSFLKGHWLKVGYELQNIDRWCNGTWISCVDTATTMEHAGKIDYRGTLFDKLNTKLGYAYSHRDADNYNQDNAFLASYGPTQTALQSSLYNQYLGSGLTAWGPNLGFPKGAVPYPYPALFVNNNTATNVVPDSNGGLDITGFGRFNTASRNRQNVHSMVDYQLTDKLNVGVNGDWRYDEFPQSTYGLQSSRNWSINFDTSYAFSEDLSAHVFYTYQDIRSKTMGTSYGSNSNTGTTTANRVVGGCFSTVQSMNNNAKIDPCRNWQADMSDNIDTVGFGLKHKGLFSGKLDLTGDFLYSFARTLIDFDRGGQYVQSPTGTAANGLFYYIPAAALPEVKTQTFQFNLSAKYAFNKSSAAHLTYMYQHLISSDYIYTGMQSAGTPTGVMPTNEKAPVYEIHAIGLSYIYSF